jgi:hypothetical protein
MEFLASSKNRLTPVPSFTPQEKEIPQSVFPSNKIPTPWFPLLQEETPAAPDAVAGRGVRSELRRWINWWLK